MEERDLNFSSKKEHQISMRFDAQFICFTF
ncbi:hypothetical protein N783_14480 [Pontibacillus marinus BH030004 = DSM 16465]|uniref:Uncharacterized protein n=1 Tax=Pontibacillus marinus BH030004 = DSM 16465 TaxID=1385511 RepID=A0A0A5FXL3_9BACI|nr:hypothetical protein N783_14480 [Pontibacillus marinus BH030004 = DSM 16465]